jgi:hypothetical protein
MLIEAAKDYPTTKPLLPRLAEGLKVCNPGIKSTSIKLYRHQCKFRIKNNVLKRLNVNAEN